MSSFALRDEASRLEAARAALTGGSRPPGRPASNETVRRPAPPTHRRSARADGRRSRRGGGTRAGQALALVGERPGITIPELANAMKDRAQLPLPGPAAAGRRGSGQAQRARMASLVVIDVRCRAAGASRGRTQADRGGEGKADGFADTGHEDAAKRRIGIDQQRPDRARCDQGLGARRARGRRGDDR
jgi:hypothetical protein